MMNWDLYHFLKKILLIVFFFMIVLWFTRQGIKEIGYDGWGVLFKNMVSDGTVAMFSCIILFFIPAKDPNNPKRKILDESSFNEVNWSVVLLLGGGFAFALGLTKSKLSLIIGRKLLLLDGLPLFFIVFLICTFTIFFTEFTSNTAVVSITIPILAEMAVLLGQNPLLFCIPSTIIASYAFMLPVATPPNAIIFSTGKLKVWDMVTTGFLLNIAGVILISVGTFVLAGVFDIEVGVIPSWANNTFGNNTKI